MGDTDDQKLVSSKFDKCKGGQHSFECINYMPDFEHQRYVLHFQCEHCELDIFDNIKQKPVINGNTPSGLDSIMQEQLKDDKDPIDTDSRDGKDKDHLPK